MKYFLKNYETAEEVKKDYLELVKKNHPDNGGNTETFKEIQNEYIEIYEIYKNIHKNKNGEKYETKKDSEDLKKYKIIIDEIVTLDGIDIDIIGCWLWVSGRTYEHREKLKKIGLKYSAQKKAWYYHEGKYKKKTAETGGLDDLKEMWGCKNIKETKKIAA